MSLSSLENSQKCRCSSGKQFSDCCQPFLNGNKLPQTALQLMRSRYTAYNQVNIDYIQQTMSGDAAAGFDPQNAKQWAENIRWCGLKIIDPGQQRTDLEKDEVEFAAKYVIGEELNILQERSEFHKINGNWLYMSGKLLPHKPTKITRTDICPCGSRKKFVKCCGK